MRTALIGCLIAAALLSVAVFADDHVVLMDEDVDFSTFGTFAVRDVSITSKHPALDSPVVRNLVRDATKAALIARGLTEVQGQAALIIEGGVRGVDFRVDRTGRPVEQGAGRGGRGRRPPPNRQDFTEGTLVIDVIRTDTKALIWRGVYHDTDREPSEIAAALPAHAAKLLSQFPRRKK